VAGLPSKAALDACRRCPLWTNATQGVGGEGNAKAPLLLVGEQPGDQEDLQGKPFVGPAGRLLREMLDAAGVAATDCYVTNAVKHFKWEPRGTRRIHKTPAQKEVDACRYWLDKEIAAINPEVIVTLGATALAAVTGKRAGIAASRGQPLRHASGATIVATYHPSALLRAPTPHDMARLREAFAEDVARALRLLRAHTS
jgi:uracil-DNA glycosylase family protein